MKNQPNENTERPDFRRSAPANGSEAAIDAFINICDIMGISEGTMMQDIVHRVRDLRAAENKLRAEVKHFAESQARELDRLKILLDETQWWDDDSEPETGEQ